MELYRLFMITSIFLPFVAAAFVYVFQGRNKVNQRAAVYTILIGAIELILTITVLATATSGTVIEIKHVGGLGLHFTYSGFRGVYAVLTAFAWFVIFLFSKEYMQKDEKLLRYDFFHLFTFGATLGIFFAADFFTVFLFFEIMSLTSYMWVAHRETKEAKYASGTYLGIAIAGGLSILMGIFFLWQATGTLMFSEVSQKAVLVENRSLLYAAAGCMFAGFGAKASAFPVHVWLPQSYTEAPAPATALLSAILSKTGIFGLLCIGMSFMQNDMNWGNFILMTGVITMVVGGIGGLCNGNLKTTIAYSSMSQIGFILVGVGMQSLLMEENAIAVRGTMLHMINHTLVKLLLFMLAAVVFMQVGSYDLNKVKGFGRKKPFLQLTFLFGAVGVGGIPLFHGYVSKTLLHESIVEYQHLIGEGFVMVMNPSVYKAVEYLFLFSGGLTLAYMTKLYIVLFVEKNDDQAVQKAFEGKTNYMSLLSKAAIICCAIPMLLIGFLPHVTADAIMDYTMEFMNVEHFGEKIAYFSLTNISGALVSIIIAIVMYLAVVWGIMRHTKGKNYRTIIPYWLDMERYIYRDLFYRFVPLVLGIISRILDSLLDWIVVLLRKTVYADRSLPYELPEGNRVIHNLGRLATNVNAAYCKITHKQPKQKNYEHKLALKTEEIVEDLKIIERSLSFGLYMFCVGLALTLIYLLVVN